MILLVQEDGTLTNLDRVETFMALGKDTKLYFTRDRYAIIPMTLQELTRKLNRLHSVEDPVHLIYVVDPPCPEEGGT